MGGGGAVVFAIKNMKQIWMNLSARYPSLKFGKFHASIHLGVALKEPKRILVLGGAFPF